MIHSLPAHLFLHPQACMHFFIHSLLHSFPHTLIHSLIITLLVPINTSGNSCNTLSAETSQHQGPSRLRSSHDLASHDDSLLLLINHTTVLQILQSTCVETSPCSFAGEIRRITLYPLSIFTCRQMSLGRNAFLQQRLCSSKA